MLIDAAADSAVATPCLRFFAAISPRIMLFISSRCLRRHFRFMSEQELIFSLLPLMSLLIFFSMLIHCFLHADIMKALPPHDADATMPLRYYFAFRHADLYDDAELFRRYAAAMIAFIFDAAFHAASRYAMPAFFFSPSPMIC